jgi:hypothetical protein
MAGAQHCGDLRFGLGQRDEQRLFAVRGQAIAFVRDGVFAMPEQRVGRQRIGQCGDDRCLAMRALGGLDRQRGRQRGIQGLSPGIGAVVARLIRAM